MIEPSRIIIGDVLDGLRSLPAGVVQCCVTSPPYYALRDYGTAKWEGGDPACDHIEKEIRQRKGLAEAANKSDGGSRKATDRTDHDAIKIAYSDKCDKCGAVRIDQQIGLEQTPDAYVAKMVEVFREVRRVLREDGTLWLNIGDSYNAGTNSPRKNSPGTSVGNWNTAQETGGLRRDVATLKPKDLCMIPWRVALALQADGWWLRSVIVWHKRSPMPESVTDRPTSSWEPIFLLSKSADYFYDAEAVKEESVYQPGDREHVARGGFAGKNDQDGSATNGAFRAVMQSRNQRNVWSLSHEPYAEAHFACVDAATECLTAEGWKRHDQLQVGELAAQFDMAASRLSWGAIEKLATYDVTDQPMIVGTRRDLSMMLTPNHRCVIQRRRAHGESELGLMPPTIIRADELLTSHRIPTAAPWVSDDGDTSVTNEWAELLGWYIAEGHESKQTPSVEIYQSQSANPEKVERIAELLRQVGAEWTMAKYKREWNGKPTVACAFRVTGYAAFRLRELAPSKRMPAGVLLWSRDRLQSLFDGLVDGDGHRRGDGRVSFIQKDAHTADMVQAIGMRLGLAATISQHKSGTWRVYFTKHTTRSFRGTAGRGEPLQTRPYTGVVWCPKLPLGTWVARRNGRVFITGNTFPTEIPRRAIKAGTSEKGCCPTCRAPWERITERRAVKRDRPNDYTKRDGEEGTGNSCANSVAGVDVKTVGWRPTCECPAHDPVPCLVLDPFLGSGTTVAVARELGRYGVGCELNPQYAELARARIAKAEKPSTHRIEKVKDSPLFAEIEP